MENEEPNLPIFGSIASNGTAARETSTKTKVNAHDHTHYNHLIGASLDGTYFTLPYEGIVGEAVSARLERNAVSHDHYVVIPEEPGDLRNQVDLSELKKNGQLNFLLQVHCLRLCCARVTCSWFLKIFIVIMFTLYAVSRMLSHTRWLPISLHKGCQDSDDVSPISYVYNLKHLENCKIQCLRLPGCKAVDWYDLTSVCIMFDKPCIHPEADDNGVSSYHIVEYCTAKNGTQGLLVAGKCDTAIPVPSYWSLTVEQMTSMFLSPRSWLCTLAVAGLYTYIMSAYFRLALKPLTSSATGYWARLWALTKVVLLTAWLALGYELWSESETPDQEEGGHIMPPLIPVYMWSGASALGVLFRICPCVRGCVLTVVGGVGAWIMALIGTCSGAALGVAFDFLSVGASGLFGGGAAMLETAAAADAAIAADTAIGVEAAVAADGAAAGSAAAEGAAAADATAAAEAASVASMCILL